jgi:hypothetical protein
MGPLLLVLLFDDLVDDSRSSRKGFVSPRMKEDSEDVWAGSRRVVSPPKELLCIGR